LCFVLTDSGRLRSWNQETATVIGVTAERSSPTSVSLTDLFDDNHVDRARAALTMLEETGTATVDAPVADGTPAGPWYAFAFHRVDGGGDTQFVGVGRRSDPSRDDGTVEGAPTLEHRERVLREMYDVVADRGLPFAEQVDVLLDLGRRELDTAYGTLSEIRGDDYVFEVVAADDDSIQPGDVVPLSATNCEIAASTERTLVLGDVERDAPEETHRAGYAEWGVSCYIGTPVFVDDEVYGTFCFYDTTPRRGRFLEWEVTLVDLMGRWVSYELQRQRTTERLHRQNERLDEFASLVSHDLRNPLNVLSGRLDLAERTGDDEQFAKCRDAIERMHALVDDLLAVARSGTVVTDTEPVPLDDVLRSCWQTVPTADATLRVETDRTVQADREQLRRLVENLLGNSVEHGSTGSRTESDDAVEHGSTSNRAAEQSGDSVERGGESVTVTVGGLPGGFYVADDGPGIPAEERDAVFEQGYSMTADGSGLGLAIVREVASAHGWDVAVCESDDGGARFEFTGLSAVR
jgi:signal transduction histidine kinase